LRERARDAHVATMKIRYTTDPAPAAPESRSRQPGQVGRILSLVRAFAERHSTGRVWWYRIPLVPILAWLFWQHLQSFDYVSILGGLNLGVHEAGHLFLGWFGNRLLASAGGTLFQILGPIAAAIMFFRQRDVFAITVATFWLGDSLASIAPYAADARWQLLNLVSPVSGNPDHDWNTILGSLGWLQYDATIASAFRWTGLAAMGASLLAGGWILRLMATHPDDNNLNISLKSDLL
jgi:hypothetical protein